MPDGERSDDLAPELGETVRRAQAELADAIDQGGLRDDPLRFPLMAVSTLLGALHRVCVDFLLTLRQTLRASQQPAPVLSPEAQRKLLGLIAADAGRVVREATYLAQVDVRKTMTRWTAAGIAGVAILTGIAAGFGVHMVDTRAADARMQAARIDVPAVFGALSAADAAGWAKLMRDNPPFRELLETARPFPTTSGKAVAIAVWINPPRQGAATH
jgi:hypothetical protein